jgi:carboxyl-terminal processing protease
MMRKRLMTTSLVVMIAVTAFVSGYFLPRNDDFFALRKNFQIFGALYEELVAEYVDPVDVERLMRSGIDAMLDRLDPYTAFLDEADHADLDILTRGRYGGVGLTMGLRDGRVTVISPVEGASGFRQGVRSGDVVTHIDRRPTDGMTLGDVRTLLRGEPGTTVSITVEREGIPESIPFELMREQVRVRSVSFAGFAGDDTTRGVGYIKLDRFAQDSAPDVQHALESMQRTGHLRGVILDLRGNPGGLLDAAVDISALFLPQNTPVVTTRGRTAEHERIYRSGRAPIVPDLPLVVLVDEESASASEIVAGAIQDHDRGVVVGATTFGKGLVQVVKRLPYNTAVKMTTMRYYTPAGRSIQSMSYSAHDGTAIQLPDSSRRAYITHRGRIVRDGGGIEPDLLVGHDGRSELEKALERRAAFFYFANQYAARNGDLPPRFQVSDRLYAEFRQWLEASDFNYRTTAEHATDALRDEVERANYRGMNAHFDRIDAAIAAEKSRDFDRHADRLKERLRVEILARFASESDQVRASFDHDQQVLESVRLIEDQGFYGSMLTAR